MSTADDIRKLQIAGSSASTATSDLQRAPTGLSGFSSASESPPATGWRDVKDAKGRAPRSEAFTMYGVSTARPLDDLQQRSGGWVASEPARPPNSDDRWWDDGEGGAPEQNSAAQDMNSIREKLVDIDNGILTIDDATSTTTKQVADVQEEISSLKMLIGTVLDELGAIRIQQNGLAEILGQVYALLAGKPVPVVTSQPSETKTQ